MTGVRTFRQYLFDSGTSHFTDHQFCGSCSVLLDAPGRFERTPDDLDSRGSFPVSRSDRPFRHFAFCPWCGTELDDEWWRETVVENERAVDHYDCPGTHKGDVHVFAADPTNHWLAVSGGDTVCWCGPVITPSIMSCEIRHQDASYEEYRAREAAAYSVLGDDWDDE